MGIQKYQEEEYSNKYHALAHFLFVWANELNKARA